MSKNGTPSLILIYNDQYLKEHLAFRGGTALHKLYLSPQPRYSEDLDLVQVNAEPVKETYDRFWDLLTYMGNPKVKQKLHNNTLIYRMESSDIPPMPIRLKVEINCKEHFSIMPMVKVPFKVENPVMVIHGDKAHSLVYGMEAFSKLHGTNKQFVLVPGATHCDLYDGGPEHNMIPWDTVIDFFKSNLK